MVAPLLKFEDVLGYMHYYAGLYENSNVDHWELINEAWIRMKRHNITNPKYASQSIRWSMQGYNRKINKQRNRVNTKAKKHSFDTEPAEGLCLHETKSVLNVVGFELVDLADLFQKCKLKIKDKLLLKQIYYLNMSMTEIAKLENRTRSAIYARLNVVLNRIRKAAA